MTDTSIPSAQRIRVLIADDDRLVRAGIVGILSTAHDIQVVAEAEDGLEATNAASAHRLDVVLLDIQMPRLDGIQALRDIKRHHPHLPVAMLTTFSDDLLISDAVSAGALGFLLKSDDPQQLIGSVRALAQGGGAFSPRVARWLATRERTGIRSDQQNQRIRDLLTARQMELLALVGQGLSNSQIAAQMRLSEGTVKQYLSALFTLLNIDNRVHAAVLAYRIGLIE
ncbi:response regulator transcription factor [Microbacterium sp.]|uniref:response regulator transcription factor n=1 Tax=Microbacterium sp. TaxID=51671 RepID=UPI00273433DB|nr:response regulator transcription factor [Microbacterium sp.]MDP3953003.1 response regulator transcription factor [Microbacterium sp.]